MKSTPGTQKPSSDEEMFLPGDEPWPERYLGDVALPVVVNREIDESLFMPYRKTAEAQIQAIQMMDLALIRAINA